MEKRENAITVDVLIDRVVIPKKYHGRLYTNATVTMMIRAMLQNPLSYNWSNQQSQYPKSGG
jgi:hypothetical protein